jgi:hypothetical protein
MSKKKKSQKITFQSVIRLIIFAVVIYFSITWLSSQKQLNSSVSDPTVILGEQTSNTFLSDLYQKIPGNKRSQVENIFQNTSKFISQKLDGFPNKQIKEIQKGVIKSVSDGIIKNIDKN